MFKPDIIWNTELGLEATPSRIAGGARARRVLSALAAFFDTYDLLITPGASTPAFDVTLRMPEKIDGKKVEHYLGGSLITAIPTLMGVPSLAVPCGFDQYGRPVGLQLIGRPRGEAALLAAGAAFEQMTGLANRVPIDPRAGNVPG